MIRDIALGCCVGAVVFVLLVVVLSRCKLL
jgi:hypothetical protein